MTPDPRPARTYGGWRRSRSIGLLGLGPAATFTLLGCLTVLLVVAAVSFRALVYVAPPMLAAGAAGLIRVGGIPLAQLAVQRLRWWRGTARRAHRLPRRGRHGAMPECCNCPAPWPRPSCCRPRTALAAGTAWSATGTPGYLTATLRVVPASTWLADPGDADQWVANWAAWLASLGYLPTAPLGHRHRGHRARPRPHPRRAGRRPLDTAAPRGAVEIIDQVVAAAPAAAADVRTWVSITFDPAAATVAPRSLAEAVTETGQALAGLESALASCGVTVLGRARASDIAGIVRTAFDPAVRGQVSRLLATGLSPALEEQLNWASAGPAGAEERWDRYQHDSGTSVTWAWREAPRQNVTSDVLARLLAPGSVAQAGQPAVPAPARPRRPPPRWTARSGRPSSAASTPAAPAATSPPATRTTTPAPGRPPTRKPAAPGSASSACTSPSPSPTPPSWPARSPTPRPPPSASRIRLQRLYRSQAAGFTATLPCGICLPELARRFRH